LRHLQVKLHLVCFSWVLIIVIRSGAVEQLRVHVRNLSVLGVNGAGDSKGRVELFERGYGKDAAGIAREAIGYGQVQSSCYHSHHLLRWYTARDNDFDVVLIDTAGRMQDNEVRINLLSHQI
jgi:signal recognition particle receptor subunit alpha